MKWLLEWKLRDGWVRGENRGSLKRGRKEVRGREVTEKGKVLWTSLSVFLNEDVYFEPLFSHN